MPWFQYQGAGVADVAQPDKTIVARAAIMNLSMTVPPIMQFYRQGWAPSELKAAP
jgi:hypothetical protein